MKSTKLGLPGSVAVIGLVYFLALALAPKPGLSAPPHPATPSEKPGSETVSTTCPHALHIEVFRLVEAHHATLKRPVAPQVVPYASWGIGRLTVF